MACQAITDKELVDAVVNVFRGDGTFVGLRMAFTNSNVFWRTGHSLDSIIDYFVEVAPLDAVGFGEVALKVRSGSMTNACWYDDYGWWGLAALRASQHPKLFGSAAKSLGEVAYKKGEPGCCWSVFHDHAPNVWANNKGNPGSAVFAPRFSGGVWNADWTQPDECGIVNGLPVRPDACSNNDQGIKANLIGIQNTVTNALYFLLAQRLFVAHPNDPNAPAFMASAKLEYAFFQNWFGVTEANLSLLNRFGQAAGPTVIRERVGCYAYDKVAKRYPHICGYDPAIAWAGDQGLMLSSWWTG